MNEPSNQDFGDTPDSVRDYVQSLEDRITELERELGVKQAQIDRLMLEYCPDEMTEQQITEWESSQCVSKQAQEQSQ